MGALTSLQADAAVSYLIAFLIPALDAVLPVLPSETVLIALGTATAGSADPRTALLVAVAAGGAFLGDNLSYLIGRRFGPAAERRFLATPRRQAARQWAERSLRRYGIQLIIACRFIPGGRTAVTLTCGLTGYSPRRFAAGTGAAAVIWVLYAFFLGRLGAEAFEGAPWAGFLLATGTAVAISALVEAVRRVRGGRGSSPDARAVDADRDGGVEVITDRGVVGDFGGDGVAGGVDGPAPDPLAMEATKELRVVIVLDSRRSSRPTRTTGTRPARCLRR